MLVLPWLGCLATYVGYLLCASLSRLGVISTPSQYMFRVSSGYACTE